MGALKQGAQEITVIQKLKEKTDLPLQIGGGLRETETIQQYDAIGIRLFHENDIYVNGWTENSGITIDDYLKKIEPLDIAGIIYTDINKDGMNQGPNFENTQRINGLTRHAVIASGGVRSKDDLDKEGRVVKGVNFVGLRDVGDPVELAARYNQEGADELVFLDISKTQDGHDLMIDVIRETAKTLFIPLTIGGGISSVEDIRQICRNWCH